MRLILSSVLTVYISVLTSYISVFPGNRVCGSSRYGPLRSINYATDSCIFHISRGKCVRAQWAKTTISLALKFDFLIFMICKVTKTNPKNFSTLKSANTGFSCELIVYVCPPCRVWECFSQSALNQKRTLIIFSFVVSHFCCTLD